ncbi:hypothetical protein [Mesorhizobium sp. WSM4904]|uniref:hypothetical protein n=1 Tax=Mesorhizobium sp. WSM4904 TaxID=3038545 RepID=UPI00241861A1|nr:hypothetical protein [Mesorhizobium sp. WSM4904]WFP61777.1 hypothetical protein QAZ47_25380 [Mesorhizobium sp. WSM4904]
MSDSLQALDWDELVGRLGSAEELETSAREAGALLRKRQVASAADLLRLCFAYVLGRFSLRMLAGWAEQRGVASMSDVAMLKRLKASADWVGGLVSELLAERCPEAFAGLYGGLRMMAVVGHGSCAAWSQAGLLDGAHGVRSCNAEALFGGGHGSP